jgi:ATP-dependent DNA helicase RecQ
MQVLIEALDDPQAQPCGRCSACTGVLPAPGDSPSQASVQAAARLLRHRRIDVLPRKLWPKGGSRTGRITACSPGRAIAYADDPGWPDLVAELQPPDSEPTAELAAMVADFIGGWRPERPDVIVPLPTPGQQRRTTGLARALGERFGIQVADILTWDGEPVPANLPSGLHVQHVEDRIRSSDGLQGGRVLLLSATARTLWSLTVASALLREAGATDVVPLVLSRQP